MLKKFLRNATFTFVIANACLNANAQDASADRIIASGLKVLKQIDENQLEQAWDQAAAFVKLRYSKDEFADQLKKTRSLVGNVTQRTWASISRIRQETPSAQISPGLYGNVDFSTRLADGQVVFEMLSFRQEPDGNWLLTGYVTRRQQ